MFGIDDPGAQVDTVFPRREAFVFLYGLIILAMGDDVFGIFGEPVARIGGHLFGRRSEDDLNFELLNILHRTFMSARSNKINYFSPHFIQSIYDFPYAVIKNN